MNASETDTVITPEIVRELREAYSHGATVRKLTEIIRDRLGYKVTPAVPVLAGFVHAFCLPLPRVLAIREWIGSAEDEEIDALLLPEIEKAKEKWLHPV